MVYIVIGIAVAFVLLLCLCLAIASFSFDNYFEQFKFTDEKRNSYGISTLDYVGAINRKYFFGRLSISRCSDFQDHYSSGIIALSENTMSSNSLASLAIVSHELGHAKQDIDGTKLRKHWKLLKLGRMLGYFFLPLVLVGVVLSLLNVFGVLPELYYLIIGLSCVSLGILIFIFALILKYKEIKIEKEASDFALPFLREVLTEPEVKMCQDLLKSARLTYWASLFKTMFGWTFLTKKESMFR